jgi:hypothetical protein
MTTRRGRDGHRNPPKLRARARVVQDGAMMARDDHPTNKQLSVPIVLVVGGPADLVLAVEEAAVSAQVLVTRCALKDVTTVAAEIRPLVMVMSDEIFDFDAESFRALARDVHSRLLALQVGQYQREKLEAQLKAMTLEAEELTARLADDPAVDRGGDPS